MRFMRFAGVLVVLFAAGLPGRTFAATAATASARTTVDTRNAKMTSLVVSGPSSLVGGSFGNAYTCHIVYSDGVTADVTGNAVFHASGGQPGYDNFQLWPAHNRLAVYNYAQPVTLQVSASYWRQDGLLTSPSIPVVVSSTLSVDLHDEAVANVAGHADQWDLSVASTLVGAALPVTYQWYLDGQLLAGESGPQLQAHRVTSVAGRHALALVATDALAQQKDDGIAIYLNNPPVAQQPRSYPAQDIAGADVIDSDGNDFTFGTQLIDDGFNVVVHGIFNGVDTPWPRDLSLKMSVRQINDGLATPNAAIYAWGKDAKLGVSLEIAENLAVFAPASAVFPTLFPLAVDKGFKDVEALATGHGQKLAQWMIDAINHVPPLIDTNKPIHLIGHSAGGYVVGECARILRGRKIPVDLVTMLDTPRPGRQYFSNLQYGYVERYTTSLLGQWECWTPPSASSYARKETIEYPEANWYSVDTLAAHTYAHEWYKSNTVMVAAQEGYWHSPFFHGVLVPRGVQLAARVPSSAELFGVLPDVLLTNFSTFGTVSLTGTTYTITEQADAGLFLNLPMPVGAQMLKLRFKFTSPGDGDFLSVSWGETASLYTGLDLLLSREDFLDVEVPVAEYAGQTTNLVFTLASRGNNNAVLQIADIALTMVDDPDNDGLVTTQEVAFGTSPLLADTDRDGLSDAYERNTRRTNPLWADTDGDGVLDGVEVTQGTNPLNRNSSFGMAFRTTVTNGTVMLGWNASTGKTYRVNRALDLQRLNYETLGVGIPASLPTTSFTDTNAVSPNIVNRFYWVELEN